MALLTSVQKFGSTCAGDFKIVPAAQYRGATWPKKNPKTTAAARIESASVGQSGRHDRPEAPSAGAVGVLLSHSQRSSEEATLTIRSMRSCLGMRVAFERSARTAAIETAMKRSNGSCFGSGTR